MPFWTASQDTIPGRTVTVPSELIPRWYGTILQYERGRVVIDTLLAGRERDQLTIYYLRKQNRNLEARDTVLTEIIRGYMELDSISQHNYKQSLLTLNVYKKVTKVSVITATALLIIAIIK